MAVQRDSLVHAEHEHVLRLVDNSSSRNSISSDSSGHRTERRQEVSILSGAAFPFQR